MGNCTNIPRAVAVVAAAVLATGIFAGEPVNPFGRDSGRKPRGARWGTVTLSDGSSREGWIHLLRGRRLRMFDRARREAVRYRLAQLAEIRVRVVRNRREEVWRFKEGGSDTKVYTGDWYCRKDFAATAVLRMGGRKRELEIALGQSIFVVPTEGERERLILRPFARGGKNQPPEELVHIAWIVFHDEGEAPTAEARRAYVAEMNEKAAARTAEAERREAEARSEKEERARQAAERSREESRDAE